MAAVTICSNSGAQENKICHCFHFSPFYLPWSDGTRCYDLNFFFNVEFQASLNSMWLQFQTYCQQPMLVWKTSFWGLAFLIRKWGSWILLLLDPYMKYLEFLLFPIISIIPYHEVRSTLSQVGSECLIRYHEHIYNSAGYILFALLDSFLHHSPLCSVH